MSDKVKNTDKNSNDTIHSVSCSVCGSHEITHKEKEGRGKSPKGWVRKKGDRKMYSWRGMWDMYSCNDCGKTWSVLRD